ncbi:MAG: hypothetical protein ACRCX5_09005 [Bacteroidales bacterium]
MIKEIKNILSQIIVWLIIVSFTMVGYVNMSVVSLWEKTPDYAVLENTDSDLCLSLIADFMNSDQANNTAEDSASQSMEEDSSQLEEDLFSSMQMMKRNSITNLKNAKMDRSGDNHNPPHIEFQSPPPEFQFCI